MCAGGQEGERITCIAGGKSPLLHNRHDKVKKLQASGPTARFMRMESQERAMFPESRPRKKGDKEEKKLMDEWELNRKGRSIKKGSHKNP